MSTLLQRFWSHVEKTDGCWLWTGTVGRNGYGVMQRGRRGEGLVTTHRLSFEIHHGTVPAGMVVMHSCNNKRCVNPSHISAGTYSQNNIDALNDGLRKPAAHCAAFGSLTNAKLSQKDKNEIARIGDSLPAKQVASRFGIHFGTVYAIRRNGPRAYWSIKAKGE